MSACPLWGGRMQAVVDAMIPRPTASPRKRGCFPGPRPSAFTCTAVSLHGGGRAITRAEIMQRIGAGDAAGPRKPARGPGPRDHGGTVVGRLALTHSALRRHLPRWVGVTRGVGPLISHGFGFADHPALPKSPVLQTS